MTGPTWRFIANPTAQSGRGRRRWQEIQSRLAERGARFEWTTSERPGHAVELAYDAAKQGCGVAVAVGGDGTINEVLTGVMRAREEDPAVRCALGIVYTGTSPDVCRYHGIPLGTADAVDVLLRDRRELVDVGRIEYFAQHSADHALGSPAATVGWFLCSVNLGVGAAVANGSNSGLRKVLGDGLGTFVSIVRSVAAFTPASFNCKVDGEPYQSQKTLNLTVGKNPFIASGLKVLVPIGHADGRLYLFAVNGFGFLGLLANLHRFYRGDFQDDPRNRLTFLQQFECAYNAEAPMVEFDGDHHGYLPCRIGLRQAGLELVK
jgi:diacylglycerol kinase family enzyme